MEYNKVLFEIVLSMMTKRDVYTTQAADELLEIATYIAGAVMTEFDENETSELNVGEPVASVEEAVEAIDEAEGIETAVEEKVASEAPVEAVKDPMAEYLLESTTESAPMVPAADMTPEVPVEAPAPEVVPEAPATEATPEVALEVVADPTVADAPVSAAAASEVPVEAPPETQPAHEPVAAPVEVLQAEPATDSVEPAQ